MLASQAWNDMLRRIKDLLERLIAVLNVPNTESTQPFLQRSEFLIPFWYLKESMLLHSSLTRVPSPGMAADGFLASAAGAAWWQLRPPQKGSKEIQHEPDSHLATSSK